MSQIDIIDRHHRIHRGGPLAIGAIGASASGWWGLCFLIISEGALFGYLFFSYFYFSIQPPADWVPGGRPSFFYPALQTGVVLLGCGSIWWANRSILLGQELMAVLGLGITLLLCSGFIALQFLDWFDKPFSFSLSTYTSEYFLITGFHLAHVAIGWLMLAAVFVWTALGYFDPVRYAPITITAVYWYFVAAVWIGVFFTLTCTPYFF